MKLGRQLIAALAISALAVPATAVGIFTFTATPAFAKGPGGQGKGNSGSHGQSGTKTKGPKSGKPAKPPKPAKGNNGKGPAKVQAAAVSTDPTVDPDAPVLPGIDKLRPNELGSMNGAMHANINAVLAHIRNGNRNGPVGALAGLAVADHDAAGAQDVIDQAAKYDALDAALADAGYDSLAAYQAAQDDPDFVANQGVEDALAALGDAADQDPPSDQELADAQAALDARTAAEAGIFDAWNKSGEATDEQKAALLSALRERLGAESDAIDAALGTADAASVDDGSDGDGTDGDGTDGDGSDDDGTAADAGTGDGTGDGTGADGGSDALADADPVIVDPEVSRMLSDLKF